jgi:hypothetical protein
LWWFVDEVLKKLRVDGEHANGVHQHLLKVKLYMLDNTGMKLQMHFSALYVGLTTEVGPCTFLYLMEGCHIDLLH